MSLSVSTIQVAVPITIEGVTTVVQVQYPGASGGGSGATTFLGLTDTPAAYAGQGGKVVAVKSDATGVEFVDAPTGGSSAWPDITGTPTTLEGYGITDAATAAGLAATNTTVGAQATAITSLIGAVNANAAAIDTKAAAGDLAAVATSGAYADLTGRPALGTAAAQDTTAFEAAGGIATHAALTTTHGISAYGSTIVSSVNAAAARTAMGLGTAATAATGDFAPATHNQSAATITTGTLPIQRGGTGSTSLPFTTNFVVGSSMSAAFLGIDAALGLRLPTSAVSAFGLTLIDDEDATAARSTLGLGTAATSNTGDFAAAVHTHTLNSLTDTTLSLLANGQVLQYSAGAWINRSLTAAGIAALSHVHAATDITSGTFDSARLPAIATQIGELRCTIDGGGAVVTATTVETLIERACTLTVASLHADQSGSITATVKRDRGGVLTTLGTVTLTAAQTLRVTDLSGWTATDLAAADILIVEWLAPTTLQRVVLTLGREAA